VLLDTTRLDVFAMEPVTCRRVHAELTVAMDLYSRCITGLRVTPVSTKAVDVAAVLFETVRPRPADPTGDGEALPFGGVPSAVVVDSRKLVDARGEPLLPSAPAETIVFDHGKVFLSHHLQSVCARLAISLQPARPMTPTDKSPLERWFKSLGEGLLSALPGYKGSDVHSRGEDVEEQAFFFLDELEAIIREWISLCYHRRVHRGLTVAEVPGLTLSPLEMFEHGVHRAGHLRIPARAGLAFEFLEQHWTSIQHYGVEIGTLRYNGPALDPYRNRTSPFSGVHARKWPVAVDPGDITRVYFQDPADPGRTWHPLTWEHAASLNGPVSREAVRYARGLAAATHRFPDTKRALVELLDRWGAGLTADRGERRMAVRLSEQRLRLSDDDTVSGLEGPGEVSALPSVRRIAALDPAGDPAGGSGPSRTLLLAVAGGEENLGGDDDSDDECDAVFPTDDRNAQVTDDADFYSDMLDSR
jgi:transposase InsO family protein